MGRRSLGEFADLGIETYDHVPMLEEIFRRRNNLTAYDAAYVVLANVLEAEFVTCDAKLAAAPATARRTRLIE